MDEYRFLWPVLRLLPPEFAHRLGLLALRTSLSPRCERVDDPWNREDFRPRNRVGIAAGLDKNAVALRGLERMGAGFVEVGTILVEPWPGNDVVPRVKRMLPGRAIWNRLGFPSQGLDRVKENLRSFPRSARRGMLVGCNIGPHPGRVKAARGVEEYLDTAREQLLRLAEALFEDADFFVVNLSSPNTTGLRTLLQHEDFADRLFLPLRRAIRRLEGEGKRPGRTPLLLKLPPEDADRAPWTSESLNDIVAPLIATDACDGFVAVNTSTRLAAEFGEDAGGLSGAPLRPTALQVVRELRRLIGPDRLLIGSGGIMDPGDAIEFVEAGSDLVEMYTGLVYRGPRFVAACAAALREHGRRLASPRAGG